MFDLMTEEIMGRGEESDPGEGDSDKLHDYREKVNVLNSDLQEIIDHGEDACEGEGEIEGISINEDTTQLRLKRKPKWGKLQNLDLIPNTYIYHEPAQQPASTDYHLAQDSIFNMAYA